MQRSVVALLALLTVLTILHGILNSSAVRERIQDRVEATLSERLGAVELGSRTGVDWSLRVTFGPLRISPGEGEGAVLEVEQVRVRPRIASLLAGRLEPGVVRLETVTIRPGPRGKGLRALAERLTQRPTVKGKPRIAVSPGSGRVPRIEAEDVRFDMVSSTTGRPLELGAWDAQLDLAGSEGARILEVSVQREGGGEARSVARWGKDRPVQVEGWVEALPLAPLVELLGHRVGVRAVGGTVAGHVLGSLPPDLKRGELNVEGRLSDLFLEGERLAPAPLGPWRLSGAGVVDWDLAAKEVRLREGHVGFGPNDSLRINVEGVYEARGKAQFRAEARVDQLRYQDALDALPPQLSLGDEAPRIPGLLDAKVRVSGPIRDPEKWMLDVKLELAGLRAGARNAPFFLRGPFIYRPVDASGQTREVWVGPKNPSFVPIDELPRYVPRSVTTSEDASFYLHPGFDFDEMKESIIDAAEGTRLRGASTITQQLAKNLFLSRERTYARKVREALLTVALEASLPKARLLEIYLNIIEWGPGIYGIGEAARHYFGVNARNLSVQQAVFLATIIPNPIRYHAYFTRGALTWTWEKRTRDLINKLRINGTITVADAVEAEYMPLRFRRP